MFCPHDKTLMRMSNGVLTCPKCGATKEPGASLVVKTPDPVEKVRNKFSDLGVIEDPSKYDFMVHPIDDSQWCGRCGNRGAYYYLMQTRKADEPTTRFYRCTKCGKQWKSAK